jgi:hypothetical protein
MIFHWSQLGSISMIGRPAAIASLAPKTAPWSRVDRRTSRTAVSPSPPGESSSRCRSLAGSLADEFFEERDAVREDRVDQIAVKALLVLPHQLLSRVPLRVLRVEERLLRRNI